MPIKFLNTVTVDTDVLYVDAGSNNVGIGTTSPAYKLDVDGQIRGEQYLYLKDTGGTNRFSIRAESTYGTIDNGSNTLNYNANNHLFLVGLSEKMRINSSGNVGIGTTTPAPLGANITTLDISGTSGGGLRFGTTAGVEGAIYTLSSGTYAGSVGNIPLYFRTNNTTRATILANGDVGIGTTSPDYKLEVNGTLGVSRTDGIIFAGSAGTGTGSKIVSNTSNDLIFSTALASTPYTITERVRILNNGNVGIGTTSPNENLHVFDTTPTVKVQSSGYYPGAYIDFTNTSDYLVSRIYSYSNPGGSGLDLSYESYGTTSSSSKIQLKNGFMYFWTAGSTRAVIGSNGNFGIGLTNPSEKLHVNGSAIISGNLGVGTTSPGEKLEVNGAIKATAATDAYKGYIKNTITCTPLMKSANTSYNYIPYNTTIFNSTPDYFNRMVTPYDGRVKKIILRHISGTTPTATGMKFKKEVNGTVSVTEYTATVTGGASTSFTAIYNFANSDFTFSEGDSIGILAQTSGGTGNIGGASAQIIVEYNIT